ncbi:MAG: 16S rRNA (adenine(1518)-N(6)/adenine(1519)-N(6))-dimethyltransferase RsmA [Desulfovibrio sp.]|jgi:16S rRNA (adenine1518-N6/adenine1519-N6)-dimethyltransferase|nr:16S rRNA (adenine(1518)-N(6)/adenine(1519)-N(6))-dimethyltransferase RsmA [Desulfovibrio sp.]
MAKTQHAGQAPKAKKSLGQHFLNSVAVCRRIVGLLSLRPEDRLIEIGPGPGALTKILENMPHGLLLLLEKDNYWAAERMRRGAPGTQVVHTDALNFDWRRISYRHHWKIVGNLPYNIASRLVWDIARQAEGMSKAVFMMQYEVAKRMTAPPGNRLYGALSVWMQSFTRPRLEFTVERGAFSPQPKVLSAVVSLDPLPPGNRPPQPDILAELLQICFQRRRKQLGSIFRQCPIPGFTEALARLDIDATRRPETLTPDDFQKLGENRRDFS